jgi:hypothetical protein
MQRKTIDCFWNTTIARHKHQRKHQTNIKEKPYNPPNFKPFEVISYLNKQQFIGFSAISRNSKTACSAEQAVFNGCGGGI